jgi:hypothetical protein
MYLVHVGVGWCVVVCGSWCCRVVVVMVVGSLLTRRMVFESGC